MDGAHTHGNNGGGVPPEAFMILAVVIGIVIVGPIVMAILQALITILFICFGIAAVSVVGYIAWRVGHRGQPSRIQAHASRVIPSPSQRREITASTERLEGHIILTDKEYEEIRSKRYGDR